MVNCIKITDLTAPELDVYARRSERQLLNRDDPAKGLFIAESPLVIGRALDAGYRPVSCLLEEGDAAGQAMLARCGDIPAYLAPREVLAQLTGFYLTRGMLCAMVRPPLPDPAALCAGARRIAVLEEVVNPTNVGAIFRSAAALGIDAVLLSAGCSDPLYRRAIRVSMGTVFQVPWTILQGDAAWPTGGQALLRGLGFQTAAMALTDEKPAGLCTAACRAPQACHRPGDRGRRSGGPDHRRVRSYREDPDDGRCGFFECRGGQRGGLLSAGPAGRGRCRQRCTVI